MRAKTPTPMPAVIYDGRSYKLRSRRTEIPDFQGMRRIEALVWLSKNTVPRGYSRKTNPLAGMAGLVTVETHS